MARAFLLEYSYKRLKSGQLLDQLGVFLTCSASDAATKSGGSTSSSATRALSRLSSGARALPWPSQA